MKKLILSIFIIKNPHRLNSRWGHGRACLLKEPAMFREETIGVRPYLACTIDAQIVPTGAGVQQFADGELLLREHQSITEQGAERKLAGR